jgi:hypothetical protein
MPTNEQLLDLDTLTLEEGGHPADDGLCLMEAVARIAGEPHTDNPTCTSPILGAFGRSLNDTLPDAKRQLLKPLIPRLIGTASDDLDQVRGLMAADWIIRVYTPTWLHLAGLEEQAIALETLPRQASWDDVETAVPVVQEARKKAYAAWAAAGAAARAAARDAARDKLQPTVDTLQDSAITLFEQMVSGPWD